MSGTYSILNLGWTALSTHKLSSQVTSHNLANAATPGYSRQRAELEARQPWLSSAGPLGMGVLPASITRSQAGLLAQRMMDASADAGFGSGRVDVLGPAETVLGIGEQDPVEQALGNFFSALEDLAAHPEGTVERQQVLERASALGTTMAQVRSEMEGIRRGLDDQVVGLTREIQARLDEIAVLNKEVALVEASGGHANDLRDRRELLASEVAERIGVTVFSDDKGNLNLALKAGGVLVEGHTAAQLVSEADPGNGGLMAPVLVSGSGARSRLDGSVAGRLGGLLDARDGDVAAAIDDLDQLAFEIAEEVNTVHSAGFGLDGISGRNLFTPIGAVAGAAASLSVDAAVAGQPDAIAAALDPAAVPGDNRSALALVGLAEQALVSGETFSGHWRSSVGALGAGLNNAERDFALHADRLSELSALRESITGVSIDEEMIALTRAQNAYEAAAKVIQAGDEMLETVLSLK